MSKEEAIVAEYLLIKTQYNYQSPPLHTGTPEQWLMSKIKEVALEADNAAYRRGFDSATRDIPEPTEPRPPEGSDVR